MSNWPIDGPRSALWVVRYMADAGRVGLESYHKFWRMTSKLSLDDWGVSKHMQMRRLLKTQVPYHSKPIMATKLPQHS